MDKANAGAGIYKPFLALHICRTTRHNMARTSIMQVGKARVGSKENRGLEKCYSFPGERSHIRYMLLIDIVCLFLFQPTGERKDVYR